LKALNKNPTRQSQKSLPKPQLIQSRKKNGLPLRVSSTGQAFAHEIQEPAEFRNNFFLKAVSELIDEIE